MWARLGRRAARAAFAPHAPCTPPRDGPMRMPGISRRAGSGRPSPGLGRKTSCWCAAVVPPFSAPPTRLASLASNWPGAVIRRTTISSCHPGANLPISSSIRRRTTLSPSDGWQVLVPVTGDVDRDLRDLPWAGARGGKRAAEVGEPRAGPGGQARSHSRLAPSPRALPIYRLMVRPHPGLSGSGRASRFTSRGHPPAVP
jgi:hypothetical protein